MKVAAAFDGLKIDLSTVFTGQNVGVKQVEDKIWHLRPADYEQGVEGSQKDTKGHHSLPVSANQLISCPFKVLSGLSCSSRSATKVPHRGAKPA